MRRKLFAGMLAVLLCFLPLWGVRAEGEPYVVQDNAQCFEAADVQFLQTEMQQLYADTGILFSIFTETSVELGGEDAYFTAQPAYTQLAQAGKPYVATLLSIEQDQIYAHAGAGAEELLDEAKITEMLQAGIDRLSNAGGESLAPLYEGCIDFLKDLAAQSAGTVGIGEPDPEASEPVVIAPQAGKSYVVDDADLLTDAETAELQQKLEALAEKYSKDAVILTTESTSGKSAMAYADDYYDEHGYAEDGILLLIDMGERKWWISTAGDCIDLFSDEQIAAIGDEVAAYLSDSDYTGAFDVFYDSVSFTFSKNAGDDAHTPAGTATVFLIDEAGLLDSTAKEALQAKIEKLRAAYGQDVVILTVNGTESKSAMAYADDYYDYNGYATDGLLLLVDMGGRNWWISTAGNAIHAFTDADIQRIGKVVAAGLKSKDYQKAFDNFLMEVDEELYDYYNGSAGPALREAGFKGDLTRWWRHINWTAVLIAEAVAALIAFLIVGGMRRRMKTARPKNQAQDYIRPGSFALTNSADIYLYSHTTSRRIERDNNSGSSGGGGGGSSTHTSSSGSSHGGGGGSF